MKRRTAATDLTSPGWAIVAALSVLLLFGVGSIYVTDTAYVAGHDGPANARKQFIIFLGSVGIAGLILRIGYRRLARYAYPLFIIALILLIPPVVARITHNSFGGLLRPSNGAYRWIRLPFFQLQPSEIMKIALIFALARYLRFRKNYRRLKGLMIPLLASAVPLFLILLEPDLGTCLLILPLLLTMLFLAGAKRKHLLALIVIGLLLAPLAWSQIRDYQKRRITAVLLQSKTLRDAIKAEPEKYKFLATPRDVVEWSRSSGYQLIMSKNAVGSGGFLGQGWGRGIFVEHPLLPDRHNDFIFAIIAHQWGFWGALMVLASYAVIIVAGAVIASATREPFGRLLAAGIVTLIALQVTINTTMTLGLMPITGMTLPIVSSGGCSLLINVACLALLISISQHRPFTLARKPFEFPATRHTLAPLEPAAETTRSHAPSPSAKATR